jgi:hypothetical protein
MNVYLLFLMNSLNWNMVYLNSKENMTLYEIGVSSDVFVINYATQADANIAIARINGVVPYVVLADTTQSTIDAASSQLLEAQV